MGIIIIFVSHNMGDVAEMADRIIVMNHGKVALSGTPEDVYSHKEELDEMGLGVPPVTEIMHRIKEEFPDLVSTALNPDDAAEDIIRYLNA
jgi:energy-coupling factor transport system ATP-binding protein